jgi:hypothetical protein
MRRWPVAVSTSRASTPSTLEATFVQEVMDTEVVTVGPAQHLEEPYRALPGGLAATAPAPLPGPRRRDAGRGAALVLCHLAGYR